MSSILTAVIVALIGACLAGSGFAAYMAWIEFNALRRLKSSPVVPEPTLDPPRGMRPERTATMFIRIDNAVRSYGFAGRATLIGLVRKMGMPEIFPNPLRERELFDYAQQYYPGRCVIDFQEEQIKGWRSHS